jgi:hypothetical protein
MALMMAGYHYPADKRLALPLYPLALMGFVTEIKHLVRMLRVSWCGKRVGERFLAAVAGGAVAVLLVLAAACYVAGDAVFLPRLYARCAARLAADRGAYGWLRGHSPPHATVYAYDDGLLYLYTGRRALGLTMPYVRAYGVDPEGQADRFVRDVTRNACLHGVDYLLVTNEDFYREGHDRALYRSVAQDRRLRREFVDGEAAVYRCATLH